MLKEINLSQCEKFGIGASRPEDVAVSAEGEVWLSDKRSACAKVNTDGTLSKMGDVRGAPNGINFDLENRILIANFGGPESECGSLQRLNLDDGLVEVLCREINGRALYGSNYPVLDTKGRIYCSHSTWGPLDKAFDGANDGFIFRYDPDGAVTVLAEGIQFANGIALDYGEEYLYVCQTTGCNVIRYKIRQDGTLGQPLPYGPKLGLSHIEVQDKRPLSSETRSMLGLTDGCGFDCEGNLWVTLVLANKIVAITPQGKVKTMLSDPEGHTMINPTNVTWGGPQMKELYIGSVTTDYVVKVPSPIAGMPLAHQRSN